jgi:hypothetical protein
MTGAAILISDRFFTSSQVKYQEKGNDNFPRLFKSVHELEKEFDTKTV